MSSLRISAYIATLIATLTGVTLLVGWVGVYSWVLALLVVFLLASALAPAQLWLLRIIPADDRPGDRWLAALSMWAIACFFGFIGLFVAAPWMSTIKRPHDVVRRASEIDARSPAGFVTIEEPVRLGVRFQAHFSIPDEPDGMDVWVMPVLDLDREAGSAEPVRVWLYGLEGDFAPEPGSVERVRGPVFRETRHAVSDTIADAAKAQRLRPAQSAVVLLPTREPFAAYQQHRKRRLVWWLAGVDLGVACVVGALFWWSRRA